MQTQVNFSNPFSKQFYVLATLKPIGDVGKGRDGSEAKIFLDQIPARELQRFGHFGRPGTLFEACV